MRRMISPGSPSSFASSEGLVVAPERMPQAAISSTSATDPVSMKSFMSSSVPESPWTAWSTRSMTRPSASSMFALSITATPRAEALPAR